MEKIKFIPDGENEVVEFFVIEQTRLRGVNYLLVTESDDETEEADGSILVHVRKQYNDKADVSEYFA